MLLPRPEMRMATRVLSLWGSLMAGGGPILRWAPGACTASHAAAASAGLDASDVEHLLAGAFEARRHLRCLVAGENDGHADPAVEGPRHFFGKKASAVLKLGKDRGKIPAA